MSASKIKAHRNKRRLRLFVGIDLGYYNNAIAVLNSNRQLLNIASYRQLDELLSCILQLVDPAAQALVAIDAPLNLPEAGSLWRQVDLMLKKAGMPCFAPAATFFLPITLSGIKLRKRLRKLGAKVIEVYPYAAKLRLGLNTKSKNKLSARRNLQVALRNLIVGMPSADNNILSSHELDAILCAYTAYLHSVGATETIGTSPRRGQIVLPLECKN